MHRAAAGDRAAFGLVLSGLGVAAGAVDSWKRLGDDPPRCSGNRRAQQIRRTADAQLVCRRKLLSPP